MMLQELKNIVYELKRDLNFMKMSKIPIMHLQSRRLKG